jgi:hypothetical protein
MHGKNAHMMPNNGSKALDFLGRLFVWFDELLKVARNIPYILQTTTHP